MSATVPAALLESALCAAARSAVDHKAAPAYAQQLDARQGDVPAGTWIVTVLDDREHRTFRFDGAALVEIWTNEVCAECGEDLGRSEDDGCACCAAYREERAERLTDYVGELAEGWR